MIDNPFEDAFNLLCGDKIGGGIHRDVFECRIRPDLVVKVERHEHFRDFPNVLEQRFWDWHEFSDGVRKWLAPCEYLSPDGRILLQKRIEPIRATDTLPDELPRFLTDIKQANFGWYEDRLVCCDYVTTITASSLKLQKVQW